jgi:Alpha/beta hydrolase of unknown function (DUF900)
MYRKQDITHPQHYFIEILPDDTVAYGVVENLTKTNHLKKYFESKEAFYTALKNDISSHSVFEDKTLVFFHGWLTDRHRRFSRYVHGLHEQYILTKSVNRTIIIIWHTGYKFYGKSRKKVEDIARIFQADFNDLTAFMHFSQANSEFKNRFYLLCHSMGNYLFQQLFSYIQEPKPCFKEYILAAPDLDCDVFEKGNDFENLHSMIPIITLLKHRNDRTLRISKYLLSKNRLGRHGLQSDTPSVKTIDVTGIRPTMGFKDNITHHLYFHHCPEVIEIIRQSF